MPKFVVDNLTDKTQYLSVEPWAHVEIMAPNGRVEFECDEPAEISFALKNDGGCVGISSWRVKISANGKETTYMPPESYRDSP
jgi:hypothetical protein